jgi:hypothetical protein
MNPAFTCIYCQKTEPDVSPSEAHIFPDAMGGITYTLDTVCKDCNQKINKEFEQSEIQKFSFFQSIWGIKSRRGKVQGVPATVEFQGKTFNITLDENGLPKTPLIFCEKGEGGKKTYSIIGPAPLAERKKNEIDAKDPSISWTDIDLTGYSPPESVIEIARDIGRKSLRRLVAKVAYERWAQLRGNVILGDRQYANIRDFILNGTEARVLCGNLCDSNLLNGMLNFPVGHHVVCVIAHPKSRILGFFVTFYSLFYFWVILSTRYRALAAFDDILIEDPQSKIIYEPLLRRNTGSLLVHWINIFRPFLSDPEAAVDSSVKYAYSKFRKAEEEFWNVRHVLAQPTTELEEKLSPA